MAQRPERTATTIATDLHQRFKALMEAYGIAKPALQAVVDEQVGKWIEREEKKHASKLSPSS